MKHLVLAFMAAIAVAPASAAGSVEGSADALAAFELLFEQSDNNYEPEPPPRVPPPQPRIVRNARAKTAVPNYQDLKNMAVRAAKQYGVPPNIFCGLITHESQWVVNSRGLAMEYSLGQLLPSTWERHLKKYFPGGSPWDPWTNLSASALFLRQMFELMPPNPESTKWTGALAAYNMGPKRIVDSYNSHRPLPEKGRLYAARVLELSRKY